MEEAQWWNYPATAKTEPPEPSGFHANRQWTTNTVAMQLQNKPSYDANRLFSDYIAMNTSELMIRTLSTAQQSFFMGSLPIQQQYYSEATRPQPQPRAVLCSDATPALMGQQECSKHRNTSKRKSPKPKQATPKALTVAGTIDFVNFTPDDKKKILTGVAPSGSSKTKTRREKEAIEKRRKLCRVVARAVRDAGGDVEILVKQGIFDDMNGMGIKA